MTHKLLLADDSVTIQRVVELTFSGEDVQVVTAGDGEQAIARIPVERPDIVLADIGMPKRSGYEVAAFVKGQPELSHIPVLLLAGAFEPVDEARAQQVRSDGVLVKPFEPQQLVSRVKDLIEISRGGGTRPKVPPETDVVVDAAEPWVADAVPGASPRLPTPEIRPTSPEDLRLDDYFERLDAAFAQLGSDTERHLSVPPRDEDYEAHELPTLDKLLGSPSKPAAAPGTQQSVATPPAFDIDEPIRPAASDRPQQEGRNLVADMFAALFAVEESEAGAPPVQIQPVRPASPVDTDGLADEVTRRVLERLAPGAANALVTQIVSDIAERLIREEIARIKAEVASKSIGGF